MPNGGHKKAIPRGDSYINYFLSPVLRYRNCRNANRCAVVVETCGRQDIPDRTKVSWPTTTVVGPNHPLPAAQPALANSPGFCSDRYSTAIRLGCLRFAFATVGIVAAAAVAAVVVVVVVDVVDAIDIAVDIAAAAALVDGAAVQVHEPACRIVVLLLMPGLQPRSFVELLAPAAVTGSGLQSST